MTDPLVSTAWLAERLGSTAIHIIDASWFMPGDGRTGAQSYAAGHIPGAIFFDIDAISDPATDLPHMLPGDVAFAEAAGALGLRRDLPTVVYDAHGIFSAPRVWWTLRAMGFTEVFVLDGGLKAWIAEGRPLETAAPTVTRTVVEPAFAPDLVRDIAAVRHVVASGGAQLVDARAEARFRGETPEPRAGLRSGHMPGARNVPWNELIKPDGTMKAAEVETGYYHVAWEVPWDAGTLKAVARRVGKVIANDEVSTAGKPAKIALEVDRSKIKDDGQDLAYVTVKVLDAQGHVCPDASNMVKFDLSGPGKIAGVGNGDPTCHEDFLASQRSAFHGLCLAVVQSLRNQPGELRLKASAEGLAGAEITIQVTPHQ